MKRFALLLAVVASAGSIASGASASIERDFNITLVGTIANTVQLQCFTTLRTFEGTTVLPGLGWLDFNGAYYLSGCTNRYSLTLYLTAPSGDTLTLTGSVDAQVPVSPWTVMEGTGRFADYTGEGTFTTEISADTLTFTFTGTLTGG
jgi:hypothetical protein